MLRKKLETINHDRMKPCKNRELPVWLQNQSKSLLDGSATGCSTETTFTDSLYYLCRGPDTGELMIECEGNGIMGHVSIYPKNWLILLTSIFVLSVFKLYLFLTETCQTVGVQTRGIGRSHPTEGPIPLPTDEWQVERQITSINDLKVGLVLQYSVTKQQRKITG